EAGRRGTATAATGERPRRSETRPRRHPGAAPLAPYTIAVGKRHKVEPRQIVGAIANEGGLDRGDFGLIDIRADYSIVELPASIPSDAWKALKKTRISGRLISLTPGTAAPPAARE